MCWLSMHMQQLLQPPFAPPCRVNTMGLSLPPLILSHSLLLFILSLSFPLPLPLSMCACCNYLLLAFLLTMTTNLLLARKRVVHKPHCNTRSCQLDTLWSLHINKPSKIRFSSTKIASSCLLPRICSLV